MRAKAIHAATVLHRHHEPVLLATANDSLVTCRRCMYWIRVYIPLAKLKKHQTYVRLAYQRDQERKFW